ncbi:lysine-2,3-aminomutase-like protein [Rhodobacter calidifons]|uniref:Lysine-2,3-aminomutase-like protein n=1 Tax=Rhodobacter calidifons TaxID=2715277 RepID=A0ABX0G8Z1_9RHOB|nr:lysine-2,3-aminomutase-like protein [Rhodobacter calidifons]NHB77338.1 lysine-2,3-aminomutase-like protein [Rhodobacter calidifons]
MNSLDAAESALTTLDALERAGLTHPAQRAALDRVTASFRVRVTPEMAGLAAQGVRAQFAPDIRELTILPEELADPIGDASHAPVPGLTHRYADRAILHVTKACEVYCRFCFRRETVGEAGQLAEAEFAAVLDYLAATPAVREVIFTGGDPLVLSARRLGAMLDRLEALGTLEVVRFHTRVPVVAPDRVSAGLVAALDRALPVWMVIHVNHPDEITPAAAEALRRLNRAGVPLLSQTVLLRGVNADADTLEALFRKLIRHRVKPYYLHHPDLAKGTGHFRVTLAEGQRVMAALRGRLSGIAQPLYVLDIPGGHGKVPVGPAYLRREGDHWVVTDPQGREHLYRDL